MSAQDRAAMLPALHDVGDQLHAAARRDVAARRRRRRDPRRRLVLVLAALLVLAAAAAGTAELLSTGEPLPTQPDRMPRKYAPAARPAVAVSAADPAGGLPWSAAVYTTRTGHDCVLVGRDDGGRLGLVRDGRFRPYQAGRPGFCGRLDLSPGFFAEGGIGEPGRSIIAGRVRKGGTVVFETDAGTFRARTGAGGAFLFVFDTAKAPRVRGWHTIH
ncbi:MAG: hypothetical protein HZB46_10250 [Solirubrobacterales bacterium]|nr:hypothetical protein [Solirubrobacterales bacterium]